MKIKAVLLLLVLAIGTACAFDFPEAWEQWKKEHGKVRWHVLRASFGSVLYVCMVN